LKGRREFEAELERTGTPDEGQKTATRRETGSAAQPRTVAARTASVEKGQTTIEGYFANGIRRRRKSLWLALAIILVLSAGLFLRFVWQRGGAADVPSNVADAPLVIRSAQVTSWSGLDIFPAISPDGNSLAYSSDRGGSFEIYVKQLTPGGREIQITSDGGQNLEPAWSPDGKVIAYYSRNRGGIFVIPAFGGVSRRLTEFGSYPSWSQDGSLIAFQSHAIGGDVTSIGSGAILSSTIWTVPSAGGTPQQLTQVGSPPGGHGSPSWSPDGKRIAFGAVGQSGETNIWSISTRGDQLKQISSKLTGFDPAYSPDGEAIYFAVIEREFNFGLWRIRVSPESGEPIGEPVEILDTGAARIKHLSLSADGKKIAYTALNINSNLWSIPISPAGEAIGPPIALTNDRNHRNTYLDISPDGKSIAYTALRIGANSDIWLMDADGKNLTQLTTDPSVDNKPMWLPGGEKIAFESWRGERHALWVTTVSGSVEKKLLDIEQDWNNLRISPDGKQAAFHSRKSGTMNIWTVPLDGGTPRQLTFDKEGMGFPFWTPDGKYITMQIRRGDDTHLAIMPAGGGEVVQLTSDPGQSWNGGISPDGDKMLFAGFRNGVWNVWWFSRSTKVQKQVTGNTKLNSFLRYPLWSAGGQIVYEYAEATGNIWTVELR
jgi:Tol biopolymer transport system component